ncbi:hypothetical protein QWJ34_02665 [Saccharibacillus sp. CPCC 101409]|nr:hypothetical protein [Saccharibacillus sp. CPCC 101409]
MSEDDGFGLQSRRRANEDGRHAGSPGKSIFVCKNETARRSSGEVGRRRPPLKTEEEHRECCPSNADLTPVLTPGQHFSEKFEDRTKMLTKYAYLGVDIAKNDDLFVKCGRKVSIFPYRFFFSLKCGLKVSIF